MKLINASYCQRHFWLRVGPWGFVVKDKRRWPLLFSQRYGFSRGFSIGPLYFALLPKLN
jgi:hypothetical protein